MSLKKITFIATILTVAAINKAQAINLSDFGLPSMNLSYKACLLPDNTVYSAVLEHEYCPSYRELHTVPTIKSDDSRVNKVWRKFKFCYHNGELFDITSGDGDCVWESSSKENVNLAHIHGGGLHINGGTHSNFGNFTGATSSGIIPVIIPVGHDDENDLECIINDPEESLPVPRGSF